MSSWTLVVLITSASTDQQRTDQQSTEQSALNDRGLSKKNPPMLGGSEELSDADHFQFLATTSARSTTRWL